ncbi:hypothetical protein [uncultured Roseovarius sp.]|uniref:hypothetical protein n=1 Tax=uncultured Roseovarius sp. TaxID=293344 RepID=UPI002603EBD1|nr:hypothetical protein [uncultured Roseovarius sp.]
MRFFTDANGNFNWAAIGGICATIGSVLALLAFFTSDKTADATAKNIETVIGDYVIGDKVEGITLEQYESGLKRREEEILARLDSGDITGQDAAGLRDALQQIDARQSDLQKSYAEVALLTADIRAFYESVADKELLNEAVLEIFDGNSAGAATKAIAAGIPVEGVGTIENLSTIFQPVRTRADFLQHVAGYELFASDDTFRKTVLGKDGSVNSYWSINRDTTGSWAWIDGAYCQEIIHKGSFVAQTCSQVFVTNSAVKFIDPDGSTNILSKHD